MENHSTSDEKKDKESPLKDECKNINIAVIGCGLVGIVAACALKKARFVNVTVYEKRQRVGVTKGLWIIFAQNAWYSLDKLGLLTDEMKNSQIFNNSSLNKYKFVNTTNGTILGEVPELDVSSVDPAYVATPVFRDEMLERFLKIADEIDVKIEFSKKLVEIVSQDSDRSENRNRQCLKFDDNSIVNDIDLILACDGVHSVIRRQYFTNDTYNASNDLNFLPVYCLSFFSKAHTEDHKMGMCLY